MGTSSYDTLGELRRGNVLSGVKGDLDVPHDFEVGFPVFEGGNVVNFAGKLRYRIDDGRLAFHFKFPGADTILRKHLKEIRDQIAKDTGIAVWGVSRF